jgi:AbiJ N-terminal domain 4
MALPSTYSRRKRNAEKTGADVYVYDHVPQKVRVQVVQILRKGLGPYYVNGYPEPTAQGYDFLYDFVCEELGEHESSPMEYDSKDRAFLEWLEQEQNIDYWVDAVEMALQYIDVIIRSKWEYLSSNNFIHIHPDEIISELNARLQEAGVGYEFSKGSMFRKDSEIIHRDVVIPVLGLLKAPKFASAGVVIFYWPLSSVTNHLKHTLKSVTALSNTLL